MSLHYDQLPASVQRRIDRGEVAGAPAKGLRSTLGPCHWRCGVCGERFEHYAKAERHADQAGHARIEVDLA